MSNRPEPPGQDARGVHPAQASSPGVEQHFILVLSLVGAARRVPVAQLLWPTRAAAGAAFARQIAMYLVHVGLGATLTATARAFARDRTTAAHACSLVEDRRDNVTFDLEIRCLEEAVRVACPLRPMRHRQAMHL
ncbi:MAG: helix-turn-helix domain-containing protein [Cucumibacter sp.]